MTASTTPQAAGSAGAWWKSLNRYQWAVFILASLGWIFDCFDQQLFTMSRSMAIRDLVPDVDLNRQNTFGGYATTAFILGWATGGLIFGVIGDLWGRARTMALTILVYALFTGLSALSRGWVDFCVFRFLTGLGVGGEFAVGVALLAEAMPESGRAAALGSLQALSAIGNILAAVMIRFTDDLGGWRALYWVGTAPALLAGFTLITLREPQKWLEWRARARSQPRAKQPGRLALLLGTPRWRRNTLIGVGLAIAGVFGLWGVAFWSPELIDSTLMPLPAPTRTALLQVLDSPDAPAHAAAVSRLNPDQTRAYVNLRKYTVSAGTHFDPDRARTEPPATPQRARMRELLEKSLDPRQEKSLKSNAFVLQQLGAACGILCLSWLATRLGRRPAMAIAMAAGMAGASLVFATFSEAWQIWVLWPLLGFCTLMPFGGFAIYFPELFPTSLRSTGVSFCYNVGRYVTASGPLLLPQIALQLHGRFELSGFRCAALILCSAYILGLVVVYWAPETRGQPLPEEDPNPVRHGASA